MSSIHDGWVGSGWKGSPMTWVAKNKPDLFVDRVNMGLMSLPSRKKQTLCWYSWYSSGWRLDTSKNEQSFESLPCLRKHCTDGIKLQLAQFREGDKTFKTNNVSSFLLSSENTPNVPARFFSRSCSSWVCWCFRRKFGRFGKLYDSKINKSTLFAWSFENTSFWCYNIFILHSVASFLTL